MRNTELASVSERPLRPAFGALRDWLVAKVCERATRRITAGGLELVLPSGVSARLGRGGAAGQLVLANYDLAWNSLARGSLGFAESYIDGDIEVSDLAAVMGFFIDNFAELERAGGGLFRVRSADRRYHRSRANTRDGSRRNIGAHYDLGNEFYRLWLDDGMTYSAGIYAGEGATLAAAQEEKNRRLIAALGVQPGDRVLEIGCGWGGLAEALARAGAEVTALTISRAQHAYASDRIAKAGLADRVDVRLEDYRDVAGSFDRIVSVEMIEAVGEENWPHYFCLLCERLKPGGRAVLQAITIREESFAAYRATPDFIQRYVFPGGVLPTVTAIREHAEGAGLRYAAVERFGRDYARTLADWRERFHAAWPRIAELGFDDRFRRLWHYYLVYCEVGFERGIIDVGHYLLHKPAG